MFRFMEDLVVITALNLSGSLERIWLSLREKKWNVIHQPRVGPYWEKLCPPSWVLPPSPTVFRRRKGSQTMHSVSVTPIYQPCEQGVSSFCFLCFLGFFFWRGGGEVVRRGKGGIDVIWLALFFPKVTFYIISYVRAFLLIQCFFNWVFFYLCKMFRKPSTCVTRWAFRLNLSPRDIVFLIFLLLLFLLKIVLRGSGIG